VLHFLVKIDIVGFGKRAKMRLNIVCMVGMVGRKDYPAACEPCDSHSLEVTYKLPSGNLRRIRLGRQQHI
jgi:hypothetical protein